MHANHLKANTLFLNIFQSEYLLFSAFQQMGYNLSPQFAQTVVLKFDTMGRRTLTLDNFIQSCVMLKSLTDAFRMRDTAQTGNVRMGYEDFMSLAVMNKT